MSNAFDDLAPDPADVQNVPGGNAFDDIVPPIKKNPNRPDGSRQPTNDDIAQWASETMRSLPHVLAMGGRAVSDAAFALPNMAGDFGVGLRNLYGKVTGSQSDFEYPSDSYRRGMDALAPLSVPRSNAERLSAALSPAIVGGGATRLPNALATVLGATPESAAATAPMFDAAGNAVKMAPQTLTSAETKAQRLADTLKKSNDLGLVVPRATTNPTPWNQAVETWGGKIATAQSAATKNQDAANRVAARYLGLNEDAPITLEALNAVRREAGAAYEPMKKLGDVHPDDQLRTEMEALRDRIGGVEKDFPGSPPSPLKREIDSILGSQKPDVSTAQRGRMITALQDAKSSMDPVTLNRSTPDTTLGSLGNAPKAPSAAPIPGPVATASAVKMDPLTLNPSTRAFNAANMVTKIRNLRDAADVAGRSGDKGLAAGYKTIADSLENQIDREAQLRINAGDKSIKPSILDDYRAGRKMIAKSYTVENALGTNGDVSLQKLGAMRRAGEPMSGDLGTLGDFGDQFSKASQSPSKIGSPGINHLEGGWAGGLGVLGAALGEHSEHGLLGTMLGVGTGIAVPVTRRMAVNRALSAAGQRSAAPSVRDAMAELGPTRAKAAALAQALSNFEP